MVEVSVRAQWFARGAARGVNLTKTTFFEGDTGPWEGSDQWSFADEPADRAYLRNGLFALGVAAAGLLLDRRGTQGGASLSPSSGAGGTRVDATDRTASEPAEVAVSPSGPDREPAEDPGEAPAQHRPVPQEAAPPTSPPPVESPDLEVSAGGPTGDLDRTPAEGVPPDGGAGTAPDEGAATVEEPPPAQEAEQPPAEEASSFAEELPPPPQVSDVELPPPLQPSDVELSSPPPVPERSEESSSQPPEETTSVLDELPPPPEVAEVELAPPPPVPENVLDELPPSPAPQEQSFGDVAPSSAEPVDEAPREEEPQSRKRVTATPAARRRAKELGIDILEVEGTGKDGKITVDDVLREGKQTKS